ncbi:UNVERIFIED_CONTAM: hypothetical protein Sangu_0411200 [Sesamum angustifolium]|uniref:Uncharacterized protein n=1 Tax=Sesamum angustifolium TaxID=2727405 RepID=A0AAW2QU71_9LAMI
MRKKASGEAIVESDLGSFSSSDGREISVGGEKQIPVDQGAGAATIDSGHCWSLPRRK